MAEMPKEHVVQVRTELSNAVTVRPGDKLVIAMPEWLTSHNASMIKDRVAERLPGVDVVIVDRCSGLAVYRDEDDREQQAGARKILDEYDNPPPGGTLVPRGWVEANRPAIERMAGES